MSAKQLSDYLVEPGLVAAGLGAGSVWWWGADAIIGGTDYRVWPVIAGLGFASTIVMNMITNTIDPELPGGTNIITRPLEAAVAAGGNFGLLLVAETAIAPGLAADSFYPLMGMATAATLGGKFLAHEYVMPWLTSMKGGSSHY